MTSYIYIVMTILFTVYGQLAIKWHMSSVGPLPAAFLDKLGFLCLQLFNPWIMSGLASALLAALSWMAAMTRFELSYAYPFMSLSFVLVLILSGLLFHEPVTVPKMVGMALIVGGIIAGSQG